MGLNKGVEDDFACRSMVLDQHTAAASICYAGKIRTLIIMVSTACPVDLRPHRLVNLYSCASS